MKKLPEPNEAYWTVIGIAITFVLLGILGTFFSLWGLFGVEMFDPRLLEIFALPCGIVIALISFIFFGYKFLDFYRKKHPPKSSVQKLNLDD